MNLIAIVVIFTISMFLWIYWDFNTKRMRLVKGMGEMPGPYPFPLIGNGYVMFPFDRKKLFYILDGITRKYWPRYVAWYGHLPEVNFSDAEDIEIILRSSVNIKKGILYGFLHPWLGTGLLTSEGKKWHTHRKLLTPTFHFNVLEPFQEVFNEKCQILLQKLDKELGNEGGFDIYPYIARCALDIICETAMGITINAQKDVHSSYVSAVYDITELSMERMVCFWLHTDFIYNLTKRGKRYRQCLDILHSFSNKVIRERKQTPIQISDASLYDDIGKKRRMAFLDLLLEASKGGTVLTDEEIREEVDTFMFEGHDTTSASLCWTLFLLGNHLDVQERVFEEQNAIFQDSDRLATTQDLVEMKYLERVLKESLRLYPSVPLISRTLVEDTKVGDCTIPEGCQLTIHIYHAHRNPKYFPDPDKFDPDNFLPDRVVGRHPFAYIPFSAGSRNCIGQKFALQEEKTIMSAIVRRFRVRALQRPSDVNLMAELILRPQEGVRVALERR